MLSDWAEQTTIAIADHLQGIAPQLHGRLMAQASSENWISNQIVSAFPAGAEITALTEVGYAAFGVVDVVGEPSQDKADVLLVNWPARMFAAVEAAMVHPGTQSKWRSKIAGDWWKLSRITRPDVEKLLFAYCLGSRPITTNPAWTEWWPKIKLLGQPHPTPTETSIPQADFVREFPIGKDGHYFALYVWGVP